MRVVLALSLALATAACVTPLDPFDPPEPVEVRACNLTGHEITALRYATFTPGTLPDGACSNYELAGGALFGYTNVEFTVGEDQFGIQPIDFVGETPLDGGRWSYELTIFDYETRNAGVQAVAD
jgi:hypothetical protein